MKKIYITIILLTIVATTGCSIKHPIAKDYGQYLINNQGESSLPKSSMGAEYTISEETLNHNYEFRSATVGYAHLWIVEFGDILKETLTSTDVQDSFGSLTENENGHAERLISFNLSNYEFKNHHAYISLDISLSENGNEQFSKTYNAEGLSQGAKMFWGGPWAMKNATQQSTKLALDSIISEFIEDLNENLSSISNTNSVSSDAP
ncbi:hypothetical protein Q4561_18080 [Alteromonas sp. 1_MG-2023]|uniref:hypothetical protein n=1 Tax=Alteromonas sp. 1_MG-2023 TaxID=3062669 RepID=UPI0026E36EC9|nr:hypothetical protein [Alteromonas sp. 1_MG-2023]MDO6568986.1 hypothetical protein [Alteromonas sp. 1_MG-2023]